ncbi:MAG: DsbA family protein, partial [Hyphomicrobiaceae bacterium]
MHRVARPGRFAEATVRSLKRLAVAGTLALGTLSLAGAPASADAAKPAAMTPAQKAEIEKIIRAYILENPEVLFEAIEVHKKRQQSKQEEAHKKLIVARAKEIFRSPGDFVFGNPKGDITVVEFFDYNCGWCKRALAEVVKLTKSDPKVRVVFKEFPVFGGEDSVFAAKAAIAAKMQGKYFEYHTALMKERRVTKDVALKVAQRVGLDVAKLKGDMEKPEVEAVIQGNV